MKNISQIVSYKWVFVEHVFVTLLFFFKGMIIMRICFQKDLFVELIHKINNFYKKCSLLKLVMDFAAEKGIMKV